MSKKEKKDVKNDDAKSSLLSAVKEGDLECVKKLMPSRGLAYCKDLHGGYILLCNAIKSGYVEIAKLLLQKGAQVDSKTCVGSPLHFAMRLTPVDTDLIRLLLEKTVLVDVQNAQKETPLHVAAKKGYVEIVQILLDNKANFTAQNNEGSTPLLLAGECGHENVVKILFDHARTNLQKIKDSIPSVFPIEKRDSTCLLHTAVKLGYKELVELFLTSGFGANAKDKKGKTPLFYSLNCKKESECVEILRLLFASNADIKKAPELLHAAVTARFIDVCKVLIENGFDVNAFNAHGYVPLHLAVPEKATVYGGNWERLEKIEEAAWNEIVKLLLNNGANVGIKTKNGFTVFHCAALNGKKKTVSTLISCGVDVNLRSENKATPLHLAAQNGHAEIVEILCKHQANVNARQKDRSTPLHLAAHGQDTIIEILLDNGCDINAENKGRETALDIAFLRAKSDYADGQRDRYNYRYWVDSDSSNPSSDDDYIDDGFDLSEYDAVVTLKQHITKLKAAGLYVSQNNLSVLEGINIEDSSPHKECEMEVNRMKKKKLNSQFTLYDFLVTGRNLTYAKNKSLMQVLGSFKFERFPIYESLIRNIYENNKARVELLYSGQKSLNILVKTSSKLNGSKCSILPIELLEEILSYLNANEVRSLVSCGKDLKRQLSR